MKLDIINKLKKVVLALLVYVSLYLAFSGISYRNKDLMQRSFFEGASVQHKYTYYNNGEKNEIVGDRLDIKSKLNVVLYWFFYPLVQIENGVSKYEYNPHLQCRYIFLSGEEMSIDASPQINQPQGAHAPTNRIGRDNR
jgi:hypothetical protein